MQMPSAAVADPRQDGPVGISLLVTSCALLVLQIWNLVLWFTAFDRGSTQAERMNLYLHKLPLGIGELGTSTLSWLPLLCAALSLMAAFVAGRLLPQTPRAVTLALIGANAVLVLWYLFTLV